MTRIFRVVNFCFLGGLFLSSAVGAQQLSKDDQDALRKTQDLLKNSAAREQYGKENPGAQQTLDQVKSLGGTQENVDSIFAISADIMEALVLQSGGDVDKMQQLLVEAQKNPEKFFNSLSPDQRAKIQQVAKDIEKRKPAAH